MLIPTRPFTGAFDASLDRQLQHWTQHYNDRGWNSMPGINVCLSFIHAHPRAKKNGFRRQSPPSPKICCMARRHRFWCGTFQFLRAPSLGRTRVSTTLCTSLVSQTQPQIVESTIYDSTNHSTDPQIIEPFVGYSSYSYGGLLSVATCMILKAIHAMVGWVWLAKLTIHQ